MSLRHVLWKTGWPRWPLRANIPFCSLKGREKLVYEIMQYQDQTWEQRQIQIFILKSLALPKDEYESNHLLHFYSILA